MARRPKPSADYPGRVTLASGRLSLRAPLIQHPFIENKADDLLKPYPDIQIGKHEGPLAAHFLGIALHHVQRGVHLFDSSQK